MWALRDEGAGSAIGKVTQPLWSTETNWFVLRTDLGQLPDPLPTRTEVAMEPVDVADFTGFIDELELVTGSDRGALDDREKMRSAGIDRFYVSFSPSREPVYAQFVITPEQQEAMQAAFRRELFPKLEERQVLLEGAYTFTSFRGLGVMAEGMRQVLTRARDDGFDQALTTVDRDNVPSLRGCARVGFEPARVGVISRRFGQFSRRHAPARADDWAIWRTAIAPS